MMLWQWLILYFRTNEKYILFVFILCISNESSASEKVWIYFTDKDNSSQKITLDDKAIKRRQKMNIKNTLYDRPVTQSYITAVEELGGVIHNKSRWLNAISVTATVDVFNNISVLPFVKKLNL